MTLVVSLEGGTVVTLLALIATIDLASFAVSLEHRSRIVRLETEVVDDREDVDVDPAD